MVKAWNAQWAGKTVVQSEHREPKHKYGAYRMIRVKGRHYAVHRLVWLYVHGRWPPYLLDHRDGNKLNNSIGNLREATGQQNAVNRGAQINNVLGLKGIRYNARRRKYIASIYWPRPGRTTQMQIGEFRTVEEAKAAYFAKAAERHGEFLHHSIRAYDGSS